MSQNKKTSWLPGEIDPSEVQSLKYVVIEQRCEDNDGNTLVTLLISDWPCVDDDGNIDFSDSAEELEIVVEESSLVSFLAKHVPEILSDRPLRDGDVFGITLKESGMIKDRARLEDMFTDPVYDVTKEAGLEAKKSYERAIRNNS